MARPNTATMKNWIIRILGITKLIKDVIKLKWSVYGNTSHQKLDMSKFSEILGAYDAHGLHGVAVQNAKNIYGIGRRLDNLLAMIDRNHDNLTRDMELNRQRITEIERRLSEKVNVSEKITSMKPGDWVDLKDFDQLREAFNAMKDTPAYQMSCDPVGQSGMTQKERLSVYRMALQYIKSGREISICNAIKLAHSKIRLVEIYDVEKNYPELWMVKPSNQLPLTGGFWWNPSDRGSRIIALDFIISYLSKEPLPEYLRGKIYTEAYEMFAEQENIVGLCSLLTQATSRVCGTSINSTRSYMIPELDKQKPVHVEQLATGGFWWPKSDRDSRKKALLNMINLVDPNIKENHYELPALSASERYDVYNVALDIYERTKSGGICNSIYEACKHMLIDVVGTQTYLLRAFPELEEIRRKSRFPLKGYWWSERNAEARITALKCMIEEAFNKI